MAFVFSCLRVFVVKNFSEFYSNFERYKAQRGRAATKKILAHGMKLSRNFFRELFHFREPIFFAFLHTFHLLETMG